MKWKQVALPVVAVLAGSLLAGTATGPGSFAASVSADQNAAANARVISDWNAIAERTIFAETLTPIPVSTLYFGFVSVAVYDAVVAIEGRYQPYAHQPQAPRGASARAAAVAAAYQVLKHYFPASADNLAADYGNSIAAIRPGTARADGVRVGNRAAASLIALRANDGRDDPSILPPSGTAPGEWRPTPPTFTPFLAPWLGFVKPMLLNRPNQVPLPGPDPITTWRYARDFWEVKAYGAAVDSRRTRGQSEIAVFFNNNAVAQYQQGMRDQATRRGMNIVDSARAFALLGSTMADAAIGCWRAKYDYNYWRPITAIQLAASDGNRWTHPDPNWIQFALPATPPYGDYVSGHACASGAASGTFSHLFGARNIDLRLTGTVPTASTRHYATAAELDRDTMNARIWLGLHFRKAMTDGNMLGHKTADYGSSRFFRGRTDHSRSLMGRNVTLQR